LEYLRAKGFEVCSFFYNPNIHPLSEYKKRKEALETLAKQTDVELLIPEYRPCEFFLQINNQQDKPSRCLICWSLRLEKTAQVAQENGFASFTTTLLVSPYQDQEALRKIGNNIAKATGVQFYYEDFRRGFQYAHSQAKERGLYCQKYCGCVSSETERRKK